MRLPTRKSIIQYATLGAINSLVVYAVYTPYVFLWLHLTGDQYVRWLLGGLPYSLATSWFFAWVIVRTKRWLFP